MHSHSHSLTSRRSSTLLACSLALGAPLACQPYDSPPRVTIEGLEEGLLPDPAAPLQLAVNEPLVEATFSVKIIRYQIDGEGRLYDEDDDPNTSLDVRYSHTIDEESGGVGEINVENTHMTITPYATLPVGVPLALLIEPGLSDVDGHAWAGRQTLRFGYQLALSCIDDPQPSSFPQGAYFMVAEIDKPIDTQLQLFGLLRVDSATGAFVGQFTNGDRDPSIDCSPHGLSCEAGTEVCRTLPAPECVEPSRRVVTPDEYPDYTYNDVLPEGYSFTVTGCASEQSGGGFGFTNPPVDVEVLKPSVTVKGIKFNATFAYDDAGVLRGSGSFTAGDVFLGTTPSGPGVGTVLMRDIPPDEVPPGLPAPPE